MPLVYPNMRLSEVVEEHPSLIPVINRLGIRLGLGDKTVEEICKEHSIDTDFLLAVINTFLNEEYFPEKKLQTFHISQIVNYLAKTNSYYLRYQLPNIERHLDSFISMSGQENQTLNLIRKFYYSFKEELTNRIKYDEQTLFPLCRKFEKNISGESSHPAENYTPNQEEDTIEALLADLKSIMIKHLTGEYNENLCYAVIFAICSLEKDIKQHDRIRYKILMPMLTVSDTYI